MERVKTNIRYATPADNVLLAYLGAKTFKDAFASDTKPEDMTAYLFASFSPKKQAAELSAPGSIFLIAEIEAKAVGYARLKEGSTPEDITGERPIEIVRIYVEQAWIGKGVGAKLMEACLEEAVKRNCDTIWLGVWELNPHAIAFYRKCGFEQVGTQQFKFGGEQHRDVLMQRAV